MGVPIDSYGRAGLSCLQAAAGEGNRTLIQYFLDQGADINLPARRYRGRTVLQAAAKRGDSELIDYLLNAGADITAPPAKEYGESVLETVAGSRAWTKQDRSRADFFSKLLRLGAAINRPEPESRILGRLIVRADIECLKVAIQAGARIEDQELKFRRGLRRSALQIASSQLNEEALEPRFRIVKLLLSNGANINSPAGPDYGRTALQAAVSCESPDLDIIRILLEGGAEVNAKPSRISGITALQGAAIKGEIHVARILLDHGAKINAGAAPVRGQTAVEGAAEHGRLDMVSFLLQMGATPDPVTGFSKAIELAEKKNSWEIVDLLKESQDAFNTLAVSSSEPSAWT
ncbi:ankyrin repeat-containing domain protein [Dactylonectria macrodidyma]|uniref:Ankyrin repeat-containing domain protein n=1 Tax=Dactylonectria macrodidyma TaxID=307937 RepID=A0A9P9FHA3_9HYPO|nr:ankyrin repeat-containing domain protein [Dactylonectria macrodidyma]